MKTSITFMVVYIVLASIFVFVEAWRGAFVFSLMIFAFGILALAEGLDEIKKAIINTNSGE